MCSNAGLGHHRKPSYYNDVQKEYKHFHHQRYCWMKPYPVEDKLGLQRSSIAGPLDAFFSMREIPRWASWRASCDS